MQPEGSSSVVVQHAYLDESGNTSPAQPRESFLVVAVLAADGVVERKLERSLKRLKKSAHLGPDGEFKAWQATDKQRMRLLKSIAEQGSSVAIVAMTLDKGRSRAVADDPESCYRDLVSRVACYCATRWPELTLVLDRRYTSAHLRNRLENEIRLRTAAPPGRLGIEQLDSCARPMLQVVDLVAWAMRRRYEHSDASYYEVIAHQVEVDELLP
ncbi:MAG: DUF3800 domain-containing protein [Anaerolineae bacterium]